MLILIKAFARVYRRSLIITGIALIVIVITAITAFAAVKATRTQTVCPAVGCVTVTLNYDRANHVGEYTTLHNLYGANLTSKSPYRLAKAELYRYAGTCTNCGAVKVTTAYPPTPASALWIDLGHAKVKEHRSRYGGYDGYVKYWIRDTRNNRVTGPYTLYY